MRKLTKALVGAGLLCFGSAQAAIRYTDAQIIEIESSEQQIHLFLNVLSGDAPPMGNGGTNSAPDRPYLMLANTSTEIEARKHMLATAMMAHASGARVRLRWDDASATPNRVEFLLIRQ